MLASEWAEVNLKASVGWTHFRLEGTFCVWPEPL